MPSIEDYTKLYYQEMLKENPSRRKLAFIEYKLVCLMQDGEFSQYKDLMFRVNGHKLDVQLFKMLGCLTA